MDGICPFQVALDASFSGVFTMNAHLHERSPSMSWDRVGPVQTLNVGDVCTFALSNPDMLVHPAATPMAMLAVTRSVVAQLEHVPSLHLHQRSC